MAQILVPDPDAFAPLPEQRVGVFGEPGVFARSAFSGLLGIELVEQRVDWCRMRLPFRRELNQPAGVVHGGVLASLLDTVVVPAVGSAYDRMPVMLTLSMTIQYLGSAPGADMVADGWVTKRGRSIVFSSALVRTEEGEPLASAELVYKVREATS